MTILITGGIGVVGGIKVRKNEPPVWTTPANLGSNHEAETITSQNYVIEATDADDDTLTYSLAGGTLPTGATLNSNGTITGPAVPVASNTQFDFTARVYDGFVNVDQAFFITINDNVAPTWTGGTDAALGSVDESTAVNIQLTAVDADALPMSLTYSVVSGSLPSGVTMNSNGLLSGTAPEETSDTDYMFTVRADDGNETADRLFTLTIADTFDTVQSFTSNDTFVVPGGVTTLRIKLWGAGGGGEDDHKGGGGGFAQADITVTPAESLTIIVGTGGALNITGGSPGGGNGGNSVVDGSGGGGYSAILRSSTNLAIAGGGGGGGRSDISGPYLGGAGGGTTGQAGSGGGGTQSAGGSPQSQAGAGTSLAGGNGANNGSTAGSGGGGGYWGGGGGGSFGGSGGSGGGGSGYVTGTETTLTQGVNEVPANTGDVDYTASRSIGGVASNGTGGLIVIRY